MSQIDPLRADVKTRVSKGKSLPRAADLKVYGRSKIRNNGGGILPTNDGRSLWARIRRDTIHSLIAMCGGSDQVSETKALSARRVGTLEAELVFMEDSFAAIRADGGEPDPQRVDLYGRLSDRQRRLSEPLGWERKQRDVTTFGQLIRADQEAEKAKLAFEREQKTIEATTS